MGAQCCSGGSGRVAGSVEQVAPGGGSRRCGNAELGGGELYQFDGPSHPTVTYGDAPLLYQPLDFLVLQGEEVATGGGPVRGAHGDWEPSHVQGVSAGSQDAHGDRSELSQSVPMSVGRPLDGRDSVPPPLIKSSSLRGREVGAVSMVRSVCLCV
mgnify:FL=1